ncbi:MAG: leucine-rich repeat protein [Muribaculaceae bacterium]|nr:leucine-rich repeat protein [Muribaculaceae bacterium]
MKKLITLLSLLLGWLTASAYDFESDGIYYNITNESLKTVEVAKGDFGYSGDIVIPETVLYDDNIYSVTTIGSEAFYYCTGLTGIDIPNSVTTIGARAFRSCIGLTSIDIPNSVITIGSFVFSSCTGLTSIDIPNSVTTIGNSAFDGCTGLAGVTIGNSVTEIGGSAFNGCTSLTSIDIPNSVTSIGNSPFYGCTGLTEIVVDKENKLYDSRDNCNAIIETYANRLIVGCKNTIIPNSVTTIGSEAFMSCTGLTSINIPNSVTIIDEWAFNECTGLTSLEIPNSVKSIGYQSFSDCIGLTEITLGNSLTSIGNCAFENCSGLTSINIPSSVISIGFKAFANCSSLKSIDIPSSVISIDNYVFSGCSSLTSVIIPNSVTTIGYGLFKDCFNLTSISISNSVTTIPDEVFSGCINMRKVEILSQIKSIGNEAFKNCIGLTNIDLYAVTPPSCIGNAFDNVVCGNITLRIPVGRKSLYESAALWQNFGNIIDDIEIPATSIYLSRNAVSLKENNTYQLIATIQPNYTTDKIEWTTSDASIASVSENGLVKAIAPGKAVIKVTCGEVSASCDVEVLPIVPEVGDQFVDNQLRYSVLSTVEHTLAIVGYVNTPDSLIIPDVVNYMNESFKVSKIGNNTFQNCSLLKYVKLSAHLQEIGDYAFEGCNNIENIKCLAIEPPYAETHTFPTALYSTATVTVPEQSLKKYTRETPWNRFQKYLTIETSIALSHYEVDMAGDEVFQLGVYGTNDVVSWSTSNPEVVYANECGLIVAMGPTGKAVISATVGDDTVSCTVLVSAQKRMEKIKALLSSSTDTEDVEPTQISIESISGTPAILNVRLYPVGACTVMNWSVSDESIATVENGIVTFTGIGEVDFTVETENGLASTLSVGIDENGNIEFSGLNDIIYDKEIKANNNVYDLMGRCVIVNATPEQIAGLKSGIYIVNGKKVLVK